MKNFSFVSMLLFLVALASSAFSQTATIDGYVSLQFKSTHEGVMVVFNRTAPAVSKDTAYTNASGYYSANVLQGIYEISFSKNNFYPQKLKDIKVLSNTRVDSVTLQSAGLSGNLSGVLTKGDYLVGDSIWVNKTDTLTIEPGTRLFFKKGKVFDIRGILFASGTETDSITFTRYIEPNDNPDSIFWQGINFNSISQSSQFVETSIMKYCHISYCERAIYAELSSPTLEHLLLSENKAFVIEIFGSKSKISNIKFINNGSSDTAKLRYNVFIFYIVNSQPKVDNIEIAYTRGINYEAISFFDSRPMTINNAFIHDNEGPIASYFSNYGNVTFNNFTIVNNNGGINGNIFLINNSILANNSNFSLGGALVTSSCIFGNQGNLGGRDKWVGVNVKTNKKGDSCDVYNNIFIDPQFTAPSNQDFTLLPTSPCIDAGVNDSVTAIRDIIGNQRIWDGDNDGIDDVDMGCYEFGAPVKKFYIVINEDFEKGSVNWNITKDSQSGYAWFVDKDVNYAHSGKNCLTLSGYQISSNSTISTPFTDLPESDNLKLTFWLSSKKLSIVKNKNDNPQAASDNQLIVKIAPSGDLNNATELSKISATSQDWVKFEIDLSKYAGKNIAVEFTGIIDKNNPAPFIMMDDVKLESKDNSASVAELPVFNNDKEGLSVYPNPAKDFINVISSDKAEFANITIFNQAGMEVLKYYSSIQTNVPVQLNLKNLNQGMYYIRIIKENTINYGKFVKTE